MRTLGGKITFLVGTTVLILTSLSAFYIVDNEYRTSRQELLNSFESVVASYNHQTQFALHYRDKSNIDVIFSQLFERQSLRHIALYRPDNTLVIERSRQNYDQTRSLFENLREGRTAL